MNTLRSFTNVVRSMRALTREDLRSYATSAADDMLGRYGYVRQPSGPGRRLPTLGAFGAGMALGTGIGALLAPQSGRPLRERISTQVGKMNGRIRGVLERRSPADSTSSEATQKAA